MSGSVKQKFFLIVSGILLIGIMLLSGSCGRGNIEDTETSTTPTITTTTQPTIPLTYVNNPLPTWTAGKFNAVLLQATGGISPYEWTLKEGSQLPEGFQLHTDGKLTGTPPLLAPGTTRFITPPFTIIIKDSAGRQTEAQLSVTILQPEEPVYRLNVNVIPAEGGRITQSLSPDTAGFHYGDLVMLTAVPEEGWEFDYWTLEGTVVEDISDKTINLAMPRNDVTVYAYFSLPEPEIFYGNFNTSLGFFNASNGCEWEEMASGTITITFEYMADGTVIGTVEFSTEIEAVVTRTPSNTTCTGSYRASVFNGQIEGDTYEFFGNFTENVGERPLEILLNGARDGDQLICDLTLTKIMQVSVDGVIESYPALGADITVVLTRQG